MAVNYLFYLLPFMLIGWLVKRRLNKMFMIAAGMPVHHQMAGIEVARTILDANGMANVQIGPARGGPLSDHYDPSHRSVNLSQNVYDQRTVAATAIAAHEVGHALQHQRGFPMFKFRSALARPVSLASRGWFFVLMASSLMRSTGLFMVAIALYALVVLFQLVTLPVELDASRRAKNELEKFGLIRPDEADDAGRVLNAAAWTYVASAMSSIGQLAMYALPMLLGGLGGIGRSSS